jgi:3-methyladenine DNA glycosylase AlkC
MAEPLKNHFGPDVPVRIGSMIGRVYGEFDGESFLAAALDGFEALELTERARHISAALADVLPGDRQRAIELLIESLGPETEKPELTGMESFLYLPFVFFVAEQGLECFETSMWAQYELTKRFTAEFSIRAFLERFPVETLDRLLTWASDQNAHVRRLVSEGTRPRLPWAPRLKQFQEDPGPVIELLDLLKDDPEEYVRRSVANNLNDISKDHPELAVAVARRWWEGAGPDRRRLVRHALRTLIKKGHQGALAILGFGEGSPATVVAVSCEPKRVQIGGKTRIEVEIFNPSQDPTGALVDFRVHFVKANGSTSPKVFKGAERYLEAGERAVIRKTISLAPQSTRTPYPGRHEVEIMLNGVTHPGVFFDVA